MPLKEWECKACPKIKCKLSVETDYNLGGPYQCPIFNHPAGCRGCKASGSIMDWKEVK